MQDVEINVSKKLKILVAIFMLILSVILTIAGTQQTSALSGSEFKPGRIIDDSVFYDSGSMSMNQIQYFLNSKVPTCDTNGEKLVSSGQTRAQYGTARGYPPPYTCLKDYRQNVPNITNGGSDLCKGSIAGGSSHSAARIIHDVGVACGINPKALIVLLEKEQSLVTDDWPWSIQYRSATGYGCPDTAPCDSEYYGFFNQVYQAAKAFRRYEANPGWYNYRHGRNNTILWHPNSSCGTSTVYIENQATASLYIYTPYRPNQAALNNLYGSGDGCSSYGNRNFWRIFNDWFSPTINSENIEPVVFDNSTNTTGELATIGFKLTSKPKANVTFGIQYDINHASSGESKITISPNNWNNPKKNIVILKGKNSAGFTGSTTFYLKTGKLTSNDRRFGAGANYTPDVPILHQDKSNEVYRLFNTSSSSHLFTGSNIEKEKLLSQGWRDEGLAFYGCESGNVLLARLKKETNYKLVPYGTAAYHAHISNGFILQSLETSASSQGNRTLYVKYRPATTSMFYTLSETEGDSAGFITIDTMKVCNNDVKPVFRLFNGRGGNHFYTKSHNERNSAREKYGFRYEGVGFYVTDGGTNPVYRLFSKNQNNHFFTASESEKESAAKHGFNYEGVAFNLNPVDTQSVFRLYSGSQGNHFYTTSDSEKNNIQSNGFRYEGIGFKVY